MNHRRQLPVSFAFVLVAVLNLNVFSTRVAQLPRSMRDARAREKQTPQHDVGLVETASSLSASQIDLARQAENGDKESHYELATLYQEGRSVEKNYVEAVKWYRRSAEQGWPAAENKLGQMYDHGRVFRSTRLRQCSGTEEPLNRTTHQSGGHLRGDRSGESPSWRVAEFASLAWGLSVLSLLAPYLALNFFRAFHTDYGGNIQASHRPERLGLGIFPSSQRLTNRVMPFYKPES